MEHRTWDMDHGTVNINSNVQINKNPILHSPHSDKKYLEEPSVFQNK